MSNIDDPEQWRPDPALVYAVHARKVPIADMSGMDRAWIVACLTVEGWTVSAIAERLACSLRLIQQIKAEPMTKVALHALSLERALMESRSLRHLETRLSAQQLTEREHRITQLLTQRDRMLDQLVQLKKEIRHASDSTADYGR